jgi:hypothetical protein
MKTSRNATSPPEPQRGLDPVCMLTSHNEGMSNTMGVVKSTLKTIQRISFRRSPGLEHTVHQLIQQQYKRENTGSILSCPRARQLYCTGSLHVSGIYSISRPFYHMRQSELEAVAGFRDKAPMTAGVLMKHDIINTRHNYVCKTRLQSPVNVRVDQRCLSNRTVSKLIMR